MTLDVKIVVFVDKPNTIEQTNQIKIFNQLGYATFVDSLHKYDYNYLYRNAINAKFYIQDNEALYDFDRNDLKEDMSLSPDFVIIFHDDKIVSSNDWKNIHQYLEEHLTDSMIDMTNTMKVHEVMGKPLEMKSEAINDIKEEFENLKCKNDFYDLNTRFLEDEDIMLYEVVKPFTDLPYTSITRNYSKKGHKPFFTDLFICQSWGVARADIMFLKSCWTFLQMVGEFNLDVLLKEATDKCLPSENNIPEPEPEVYRRDINSVIKILQEKRSLKTKVVPDFIKNKITHA